MVLAFCTHAHAESDLQIPLCTTEVVDALRKTARAEPMQMVNMSAAHCLTDRPGRLTLLHEAARSGAFGSIQSLVNQGADPFAIDRRGATPLHWAASRGSDEAVQALLDSIFNKEKRTAMLQVADLQGLTPLDHAEVNSRIRAAIALVRNGAIRGGEDAMDGTCPGAAVDAVLLGRPGDLQDLLKESSNFFSASIGDCTLSSDPREWNLLHLATAVAALSLVPQQSSAEIVKQLLSQGIDATREDAYGQTPLYFAVKAGRLDLVQQFLDSAPQDVNHMDADSQTPLLYAARDGKADVAKLLLAKGADAERPDSDGLSARDWALENGHDNVVVALSVVPKGVRGSSGKLLPRNISSTFPGQELCIMLLILSAIVCFRMIVGGIYIHCKCRREGPIVERRS